MERLELIEEMLKKNDKDVFLNYAAALEYHKIGEIKKSIGLLEHILDIDKSYLAAYYQLGKLYEEPDRLKKAIDVYRRGRKIASEQKDEKALGELTESLMILDDEFDGAW